jgi:transcriptional regulator with XRE-family HTH domain
MNQPAAREAADRLSAAIKAARKQLGWIQPQLAHHADLTVSTVQRIETRHLGNPNPAISAAIENAFGWPAGTIESVRAGGLAPAARKPEPALAVTTTTPIEVVVRVAVGDEVFKAIRPANGEDGRDVAALLVDAIGWLSETMPTARMMAVADAAYTALRQTPTDR